MPRSRTYPGRLALTLTLVALLCGCYETAAYKETRTRTLAYTPDTAVRVATENGAIAIHQGDREDIEIVSHLRAVSDTRLKQTEVVAERADDGVLSVWVKWPDDKRRGNEGCSFEILLPGANGVDARTSNGNLDVSGLAGDAVLHTSNGAIDLSRHDGPATAETSNGAVTLVNIAGTIAAHTSNGRITVERAAGSVEARTSNGAIRIALSPACPGPVDLTTSNGSIDLGVGDAFSGTLELRTSNGSLQCEELPGAQLVSSSKDYLKLAFGEAGHASILKTSNGSIRLNRLSE